MRRKRTVAAGVGGVLALAAAATAIAAPGGGPLGVFDDRGERQAEQARALGEKLGVAPGRVERALREIHAERREAREDEMARALAERLEVSAADAERALERAFAEKRERRADGPPQPGERRERDERGGRLATAIAAALDKEPAEVRQALTEIRRERLDARLAEAVREDRLTQEQADEIRQRVESGRGPGFGRHGGGRGHGPGAHGLGGGGGHGPRGLGLRGESGTGGPDGPGGPPDGGF